MTTLARIALALGTALVATTAGAQEAGYAVGPGDRLAVSIYGKPDLSGTFEVRVDGTIALHLLGDVPVAGATVAEIERRVVDKAAELFTSRESVVVDVAEYRKVFVLGAVQNPGAYDFRPGMTVMKAVALAGGIETLGAATTLDDSVEEARRRAVESQSKLEFAEAEQAALAAELARLAGTAAAGASDEAASVQDDLIGLRRALRDREVEGSQRQRTLAQDEAGLFAQRRVLIASQITATEEQLGNVTSLVTRGLARREQALELQVDADDFRADELEAAAFEARARQTTANAENAVRVAETRYHQTLLADKIEVDERVALARANLKVSLDYLRQVDPAAAQGFGEVTANVYEVYRDGTGTPEPVAMTAPISPDDVLMIRTETVTQ